MRKLEFFAAVLLLWVAVPALHGQSTTVYNAALPQIAYGGPANGPGGNWQTQIVITSISGQPEQIELDYFDTNGNPLMVPFNGTPTSKTALTIPVNGQMVVTPDATGSTTAVGWAGLIYNELGLKIQGVFIWQQGANITQAVAPPISLSNATCIIPIPTSALPTMPFDMTGAGLSAYAFANTLGTPVTMTLNFYDQNGNSLGTYTPAAIPAYGHTQFGLNAQGLPAALAGAKGSLQISGAGVVPLGFKFYGSIFTTWLP